jgi:hypothetical protein
MGASTWWGRDSIAMTAGCNVLALTGNSAPAPQGWAVFSDASRKVIDFGKSR